MGEVRLEAYKSRERDMAVREARHGFLIHAAVTAIVALVLIGVNVFVATEFPWSVFPAVGMSIGVWFHWYFGVRHVDAVVYQHQEEVESEVSRRAA